MTHLVFSVVFRLTDPPANLTVPECIRSKLVAKGSSLGELFILLTGVGKKPRILVIRIPLVPIVSTTLGRRDNPTLRESLIRLKFKERTLLTTLLLLRRWREP